MKKSLKPLLAAAALTAAVVSCKDPGTTPGPNSNSSSDGPLVLTADKQIIANDDQDIVTFTVEQDGADVTGRVQICSGTSGLCLSDNTFKSTGAGVYEYYAYFNDKPANKSNTVQVAVVDPDNVELKFHKTVTFFNFTATTCTWCGPFKDNYSEVEADYGDNMTIVNCYTGPDGGMYSNPLVGTALTETIRGQFVAAGISGSGYPYCYVDFVDAWNGGAAPANIIRAAYAVAVGRPAKTGIKLDAKIESGKIVADAEFFAETNGQYWAGAVLLEDGIVCEQSHYNAEGGKIDAYSHHAVLRDMGTDNVFGDDIGVIPAGTAKTKRFSFDLDGKYNTENLSVVVCTVYADGSARKIANSAKCAVGGSVPYRFAAE